MPRLPRKVLFDESEPGIYHCVNRCVRRAFLCGTDPSTGECFEHRKRALQERLAFLAGQLGVDILGFAVMSNHTHVVARNRPDVVATRFDAEVARRWWNIFPPRRTSEGAPAEPRETDLLMITLNPERLAEIRRRLSNISWFMRCLVEPIARQANREDKCSGRFWQGRYFCQKILDDTALAACLVYVDLNPIRAGICETRANSQYTSVYERLMALKARAQETEGPSDSLPPAVTAIAVNVAAQAESSDDAKDATGTPAKVMPESGASVVASCDAWLSPLELTAAEANDPVPTARASHRGCVPMAFAEYWQLLDWTGRQYRTDKRGVIPSQLAPIFERLSLGGESWFKLIHDFRRKFRRTAGKPESLTKEAQKPGGRMPGLNHSRDIFNPESAPRRQPPA
ncbi:MAG: hypothetical protein JSS02_05530 [Planctomycetes bacterium]|nr:hypothetical protein [Planctomycetota bacterium]